MTRIDRYLGRAVVVGTLLALLLLVSINAIVDFAHYSRIASKADLPMSVAVARMLLSAPRRIVEFFPTAMLLGSLLSLGNMAARNELLVIRTAGVSLFRIAGSVLMAAAPLVIAVILFGEFAVPAAEQALRNVGTKALGGPASMGMRGGLWARDGDRFINVGRVYPDNRLDGIWVYEMQDGLRLVESVHAGSAIYRDGYWELTAVLRSRLQGERVVVERHATERWPRLISPETIDVVVVEPEKMSARRLLRYIGYLKRNDLDPNRYEFAFWSRFAGPLTAIPLLLLAVPFAFSSMRSSGAGQRLFIGLVVGVVFHLFKESFNNLGIVYGLSPLIGAFAPVALLSVIALLMLKRAN